MAKIINFLIYGYTPSLAWNVTLLSFFALSALVHSYQAYRSRFWIFFPTLVLGALVEVMGYAGRVWSSKDVYVLTPYLMQICLLIMAPVFFSAFLYIVLGMAIHRLGPQYSLLSPRMYFFTFIIADIVSLILQAVGGGQAASGAGTGKPTQSATNIMVAGIIFQLVTMAIFMSCGVDFAIRRTKDKPYSFRVKRLGEGAAQSGELGLGVTGSESSESGVAEKGPVQEDKAVLRKWWTIMLAVLVSSTMILLRGFFRSVELSEGWGGFLVTHENFQASLDGIPMVIAVGIFNFVQPGLILGPKSSWKGYY